ncbi:MAG: TPM domain-containing protein [Chlorobium sp.]|uniref:TPM domain-containing protein n=1 Tax=Chlorobium sp. TaxID=1095 RepID=UPI0025C67682|nr:TPM domain-containing protein [Chlorobium sp.]MCF8383611.1 TPM domain-containing protein [Chlorobium sp.]
MKQTVSDQERSRLDERVAETERRTGTQIVLSVIQRSDSYAELPWKAFALGASAAGLILLLLYWRLYDWYPDVPARIMVVGILSCGALLALMSVAFPRFAKCFLSDYRAEAEVRQYAKSLFLDRELFATQKRRGILLLLSLFERRVVILPDRGLDERFREEDVEKMIAAMTPFLKRKQIGHAFDAGLDCLTRILTPPIPEASNDELPNEIIEEKGI